MSRGCCGKQLHYAETDCRVTARVQSFWFSMQPQLLVHRFGRRVAFLLLPPVRVFTMFCSAIVGFVLPCVLPVG